MAATKPLLELTYQYLFATYICAEPPEAVDGSSGRSGFPSLLRAVQPSSWPYSLLRSPYRKGNEGWTSATWNEFGCLGSADAPGLGHKSSGLELRRPNNFDSPRVQINI